MSKIHLEIDYDMDTHKGVMKCDCVNQTIEDKMNIIFALRDFANKLDKSLTRQLIKWRFYDETCI